MSKRLELLNHWLQGLFDTNDFELSCASEDASFRFYYRVSIQDKCYIVMDAPPEHEDIEPFIRISHILYDSDINAPVIFESQTDQGFLLLSDFGDELYLDKLNPESADKLYADAISTLVRMQINADVSRLDNYDEALLRREMHLFNDWLIEQYLNIVLDTEERNSLDETYNLLVQNALEQPQVFVHRDYHSRNLMLTNENNPGVIDYQDAVLGPFSYDLVSLLKDCYIKWPQQSINRWLDMYIDAFTSLKPDLAIDKNKFKRWFDLMGAQRHLKASGIFARLSVRDGKQGYIKDIPRTLSYILDLETDYPELTGLCQIIEKKITPHLKQV